MVRKLIPGREKLWISFRPYSMWYTGLTKAVFTFIQGRYEFQPSNAEILMLERIVHCNGSDILIHNSNKFFQFIVAASWIQLVFIVIILEWHTWHKSTRLQPLIITCGNRARKKCAQRMLMWDVGPFRFYMFLLLRRLCHVKKTRSATESAD
jgi:hypothetical protein